MSVRLLFVHALSPLHAGTGQSSGAVELAIARDRATGFPVVPGSSLKGSLRDRAESLKRPNTIKVFGPETQNAHDHAGSLMVGDANLLLLPVRSVAGTFAWVTSPILLARFARDAKEAGAKIPPMVPAINSLDSVAIYPASAPGSGSALKVKVGGKDRVVFEDLDLDPAPAGDKGTLVAAEWADNLASLLFPAEGSWQTLLKQRFAVVHDDVMTFLSQHATDVVARVALKDDSKTVDNLWHEESLPVETVLSSLLVAVPTPRVKLTVDAVFDEIKEIAKKPVQLGGKATVGRGRCRLVIGGAS